MGWESTESGQVMGAGKCCRKISHIGFVFLSWSMLNNPLHVLGLTSARVWIVEGSGHI